MEKSNQQKAVPVVRDNFLTSPEAYSMKEEERKYMKHVLLPYGIIKDRVKKLVEDILADFKKKEIVEVTVLVIMTGAKFFYDDMVECGLKSSETLKVTPAF
jgi:hypothetical protein